ncbi:MAG: (Fe-S)-binding protein [Deltaproteobacteria bacterium]|nr:(Fe-S)-binding protein [Deltaproteobacteria bacterium]
MSEELERLAYILRDPLFPCIQCGKCTGGCPISVISPHFNIRRLLYDILNSEGEDIARKKEMLWDCSTCTTCVTRCPKEVDPADLVISMRSVLVEDGQVPPKIRDVLKSISIRGNPWNIGQEKRSEWAEGLEIKSIADAEVLYYVGCTPAFDPRLQKIAKALAHTLNKAGVNFGTLGNDEVCCGNEIRRMGDIWSFDALKEMNMEMFKQFPIKQIITTSPHCYNTFKNEYEELDCEVHHYTQIIADLIKQKKLTFSKIIEKTVTYHDPCFLGRQNQIFDEPRAILKSIPSLNFVEMDRVRERTLCCEGGGGRMWIEAYETMERTATIRVQEALDCGAEILATACPFCLLTLEDAVKSKDLEDKIQVLDIIEIVSQAIE